MFISFGTDSKHLGSFNAPEAVCEVSGKKGKTMSVYAKYFQLMMIPMFSVGKRVYSKSTEGHEYQEDANSPEIQQYMADSGLSFKTPFYHYSGVILGLIIGIFVLLAKYEIYNPFDHKSSYASNPKEFKGSFPNTVDHLEDPEVGDIYLMAFPEYKEPYSIYKIVDVNDDSVYFIEAKEYFEKHNAVSTAIKFKEYTFKKNPAKIAWGTNELMKYYNDMDTTTVDPDYIKGKGHIFSVCRDEY